MKYVGIIGAGWLGMNWVKQLSETNECIVRYTNRSGKYTIEKTEFYPYEFGNELSKSFSQNLDCLFITAILPKESNDLLLEIVSQLKHLPERCTIVFTSTIGVYTAENGIVDEKSTQLKKDSVYFQFEQLLQENFPDRTIILRLGGLIGEDRHPVYHLSGRKNIPDGQKPVNLIHKEDILRFFELIVSENIENGIYNLVYPDHLSRKEYYTKKAQEKGIEIPVFEVGEEEGKTVSSEKSRNVSDFDYRVEI